MANSYFQFKQFVIHQDNCAMKVTTDGCLFGAYVSHNIPTNATRMLDIGAGTGLLSLMAAQKNKLNIDAVELDKSAFEQAVENSTTSPWAERINMVHADARTFKPVHKYDVIASNPPFYEKELKSDNTKKNIAHHNEGLLLTELITIIKQQLLPSGIFYLLLPYKRNDEIKKLMAANGFAIQQLTLIRQSVSHDYFRILLAGKFNTEEPVETMIDEIAIKDKEGSYTPAFTSLLKDYYLHL